MILAARHRITAWNPVFEALTGDRGNQDLMIDSTIVRAHRQAAA